MANLGAQKDHPDEIDLTSNHRTNLSTNGCKAEQDDAIVNIQGDQTKETATKLTSQENHSQNDRPNTK